MQFFLFRLPTRTHEHVMDTISNDEEAGQANRCKADDFEIEKRYQCGYMYTLCTARAQAPDLFFAFLSLFAEFFSPFFTENLTLNEIEIQNGLTFTFMRNWVDLFFSALLETKSMCNR